MTLVNPLIILVKSKNSIDNIPNRGMQKKKSNRKTKVNRTKKTKLFRFIRFSI